MTQTSGINLKIGGLSSFLSGMTAVANAYNKAGAASAANAAKISKYGDAVQAAGRRVIRAQNAETKAWNKNRIQLDRQIVAYRNLRKVKSENKSDSIAVREAQEELNKTVKEGENAAMGYVDALSRTSDALAIEASWMEKLAEVSKGTEGATREMATGFIESATGIKLTTAASAGLVTGLVAVVAAFVAVKVAISIAKKAFELFKSVVRGVIDVVKKVVSAINTMVTGTLGILAKLTAPLRNFFSRMFSVAGGVALYDVVRKITYAIKGMVRETITAVASFQKLHIQFATIAARDYAREFGVGVAEAYEKSAGAAQELLDWVKKLSVQVPVEAEYIARMLALSNAMGLTTQKSKEVVKATMNFGAALGLASDRMWNIIYNFGQMIQRGKLTGEEFRDLSRNFVPINDILATMAERVDMTTEDFRELAMEGGVPVMEFLDEFIRVANEDFPGALEKMGRTLDGVTTRFKSFVKVFIGLEALGPMADSLAGKLADMLDVLTESETGLWAFKLAGEALRLSFEGLWTAVGQFTSAISDAFKVLIQWNAGIGKTISISQGLEEHFESIGKAVGPIQTSLWNAAVAIVGTSILISNAIKKMAEKIRKWAGDTDTTFASLARRAFDWGVNFISQFANGIAQAINLLVIVINTIANILSSFFGPGSPPRIAPEIDQWGKAMMEEFYRGFLLADLGVISKISGLIESWIRSLDIDELGVVPMILGARSAIQSSIKAVRDGLMSIDEAARRVASSIGRGGEMFYDYAKAMLELDRVSRLVTEAQEELNAVTEYYDDLLRDLHNQLTAVTEEYDEQKRLAKIGEAMATGLLTAEEMERLEMEKRAILLRQQIRATEEERDIAIDAAQDKLDLLRAEEDLMQARVTAIEQYIKLQMDMNNLMKEQADLLDRLAKAGAGDGEEAPEEDEPPIIPGMAGLIDPPDFSQLLIDAKKWAKDMEKTLTDAFQPLTDLTAEGGAFSNLTTSLENLKLAFGGLVGEGGVIGQMTEGLKNLNSYLFGEQPVGGVEGAFRGAMAPSRFEEFAKGVERAAKTLHTVWTDYLQPFFAGFLSAWPPVRDMLIDFGESMQSAWENIGVILEYFTGAQIESSFIGWFATAAGKAVATPIVATAKALQLFGSALDWITGLSASFWTNVDRLTQFFANLGLVGEGIGPEKEGGSIVSRLIDNIKDLLTTSLPEITTLFTGLKDDVVQVFKDLGTELIYASIIPDMLNAIKTEVETRLGETVTIWNTLIQSFSTDITTAQTNVTSFVEQGLVPLEEFVRIKLRATLRSLLADSLSRLNYMFNDWLPTGIDLTMEKLGELIELIVEEFKGVVDDITKDMREFRQELSYVLDNLVNITSAIYALIEAAEALEGVDLSVSSSSSEKKKKKLDEWWESIQDGEPPYVPPPKRRYKRKDPPEYAQYGGRVAAHAATIVGERRPELFIPDVPGVVIPRIPRFFENMLTHAGGRFNARTMGAPVVHGNMSVDNSVNLEMNPTYEDVQLPNEIFYDVMAALNASKR